MNFYIRKLFTIIMLAGVTCSVALSGCSSFKRNSPAPLNREEKSEIAGIEQREASGDMTAMEADIEKNAVAPGNSFKF